MRGLASKGEDVFGLPEKWEFDYSWALVKIGFWLWMTSGFERLPTQEDVMRYDPRWVSDMQLAYRIYSFYKNDSPLFNIMDQAGNDRGEDFIPYNEGRSSSADWAEHNWGVFLQKAGD